MSIGSNTSTESCVLAHPEDNVATVIREVREGEILEFEGRSLAARERIPAWHKVAVEDIARGKPVRKYGYRIGVATASIRAGETVHSHNLRTEQGD